MNSFIGWIGGKKLLRKAIIERFPVDGFNRYIEVFGGAGWVLFGKEPGKELEVFNDINSNLINLYRCIKYHGEELQKELNWLLVSREQFFDNKCQLDVRGLTDIQRAARYFYIIKVSFGSDHRSFGTNKRNLLTSIEYLHEVQERLKNVVIENKDFSNLIEVYDRPSALFYLDPPYHGTEKYYGYDFGIKQHVDLNTILKNINGRFILSYNDDEFIRELYKDFHVEGISRNCGLSNKSEAKNFNELIIRNF